MHYNGFIFCMLVGMTCLRWVEKQSVISWIHDVLNTCAIKGKWESAAPTSQNFQEKQNTATYTSVHDKLTSTTTVRLSHLNLVIFNLLKLHCGRLWVFDHHLHSYTSCAHARDMYV